MVRPLGLRWGQLLLLAAALPASAAESDLPDKSTGVIARLAAPAAAEAPAKVAEKVDEMLRREVPAVAATASQVVGDELYLRRVHLDLVGRLPAPE